MHTPMDTLKSQNCAIKEEMLNLTQEGNYYVYMSIVFFKI